MSGLQYLYTYALTVPIFFLIDMLWLGVIAKNLYRTELGAFLADKPNWPAAIIFYLLYIVGIVVLAVAPALDAGTISKAIFLGALFGGLAYATYDLTNLATLKDWPLKIVLIDIAWGTVLTATVAAASYAAASRLII